MTLFSAIDEFLSIGRTVSLALSPDGSRLVAVRQEIDVTGTRWVPALWSVDPAGVAPAVRLTWSTAGESQPVFRPDNSLLFVSTRPDSAGDDDEAALWELPLWGEARVVVRLPGGVGSAIVARGSGNVLVTGGRMPGTHDAASDREARIRRYESGRSDILHDGHPVRHWDHELGLEWHRLFAVTDDEPRDLVPAARGELRSAIVSVTADGLTAATTWNIQERRGQIGYGMALIDIGSGEVTPLRQAGDADEYTTPSISPDGLHLAAIRRDRGDFEQANTERLIVLRLAGKEPPVEIGLGDVHPESLAWSGDGSTLVVAGDLHGRGALLTVDVTTWSVHALADDAVYDNLCVGRTGAHVYALRSSIDRPPHPVRVGADGTVTELPAPDPVPRLPGTLTEISATARDGATLRAWLCLPDGASADQPAPVQQWIHGGPFTSYNRWYWRSCPWVAVARGYAVVLPDPALSTGYGPQWIERGWPHRAAVVWGDVESILDAALTREDLDGSRTGLFGASFGGFMTNWVAGHSDRFKAIVTHAGVWALPQEHATTDLASWKQRIWGFPEEHPEWYEENSPHKSVALINTPMLVVHGNRDYRVPVSEALRLWWDLLHHFDGEPGEIPHRFLQFTTENHWILSPANAGVWYETVLGFMDQHVRG